MSRRERPAEPLLLAPGFWRGEPEALLARLGTTADGLATEEAAARLARLGPNLLHPQPQRALLLELLARFKNPLLLLLLAASAVSGLTGDRASFLIIACIVLLSVTLDFIQEYRAGKAAERLRQSVAIRVTARRDGRPVEIPARDLVPGDVIELAAGDLVPADSRLLAGRDLFINQALLTGEPYPVEKSLPPSAAADSALAEAGNAVFMGTSVISGTARALVCRTGAATALGEIGLSLEARPPATAFELGTRSFGLLILRLAVLMVLFVLLVNQLRHRALLESFLFAIALAVGLTPELLPMIVSVTLARGALRMAGQHVIVKRLAAILDLGAMDVLCTDKTGTLTEAQIRLEKHLSPEGEESPRVLSLAFLNSTFQSGLHNPMDEAILAHTEVDAAGWEKLDEVPFDFERRRVSVLARQPGQAPLLIVKGACEDILAQSGLYETAGGPRPLDAAAHGALAARFGALCAEGYRVLGVATRTMPADCRTVAAAAERELTFAGFAAFEDPAKASAGPAIQALARSGIAVKVVTGDNELVTRHLCKELGLPVRAVLTGPEIQRMGDDALAARVEEVDVFSRVTPQLKSRILLALKRRGHTVGFLGDGINDAPSLHAADVGISVAGGVDVAKAAADLILLEPDLSVLHRGVREGRRTFGNIMKYILMGTSSNFGNMFSMAGAAVALPFLPMLPVQVLLNNLLYDISEIPIPLDSVDEEQVERPRRWDMRFVRNFMFVVGPVSSAFDFLTFFLLLRLFHAGEVLFHTGWFIESLATQVLVIFIIRTRRAPWSSRPHPLLAATSLAVVALALLLPWTAAGRWLGFAPPPLGFFLALTLLVALYLGAVELAKQWFYRRIGGSA
ncbi:MAG TPA: magnesium-translocating P-type ATPase [Thermoanaerobaculia bacterium]|nr:magnesium-translocating P-type ATPase [Thermoanaerobaculia bacterium]